MFRINEIRKRGRSSFLNLAAGSSLSVPRRQKHKAFSVKEAFVEAGI